MVEVSDVGKMVKCPNCGEIGKVGIEKVSVKGKIYHYLSVRHYIGHGKVKRCLIKRVGEDEVTKQVTKQVTKLEVTKPAKPMETKLTKPVAKPSDIEELKKMLEDHQRAIKEMISELLFLVRKRLEGVGAEEDVVIRTVTKHDERRAKVYLPVSWVGRKVRISLLREEG